MKKIRLICALVAAAISTTSLAAVISIDAVQTGGFYADGTANNTPGFQNYFVGYGTTPGFGRTPERRSFFWFSLAGISEPVASATLHLKLPFGGLIFGKGPGDPLSGPVPSDTMEIFQLSGTPISPLAITSPTLTPAMGIGIFGSFASLPAADPHVFGGGAPPPPPDGHIDITLNALGLMFLNTHLGGDIVLTGYMPTWTEDLRPDPFPPPDFFEASELIFGLTDIPGAVPVPSLSLEIAALPEPGSEILVLTGLMLWIGARRLRHAP